MLQSVLVDSVNPFTLPQRFAPWLVPYHAFLSDPEGITSCSFNLFLWQRHISIWQETNSQILRTSRGHLVQQSQPHSNHIDCRKRHFKGSLQIFKLHVLKCLNWVKLSSIKCLKRCKKSSAPHQWTLEVFGFSQDGAPATHHFTPQATKDWCIHELIAFAQRPSSWLISDMYKWRLNDHLSMLAKSSFIDPERTKSSFRWDFGGLLLPSILRPELLQPCKSLCLKFLRSVT